MTTLLYTHPACLEHDPGPHHPESPARLRAVLAALDDPEFSGLERREAPEAEGRRPRCGFIRGGMSSACSRPCPNPGYAGIDADTILSPGFGKSGIARGRRGCRRGRCGDRRGGRQCILRRAPAGTSCRAASGRWAFACSTMPRSARCGRARCTGSTRVAVIDFDVHHGNGTQAAFESDQQPFLRLDPPIPALSGDRRGERDRGRQHRQRAAPADGRLRSVSPRRSPSGCSRPSMPSGPSWC